MRKHQDPLPLAITEIDASAFGRFRLRPMSTVLTGHHCSLSIPYNSRHKFRQCIQFFWASESFCNRPCWNESIKAFSSCSSPLWPAC